MSNEMYKAGLRAERRVKKLTQELASADPDDAQTFKKLAGKGTYAEFALPFAADGKDEGWLKRARKALGLLVPRK